jgi:uncharacterized membrane protein (UPF0127 family)
MSQLISLKNQKVIADKCVMAISYFERLRGLIGRAEFSQGEAMFFPRCNDIHMWFMRIPIDVVFVSSAQSVKGQGRVFPKYKVTRVFETAKPWKLLPIRDGKATETVELPVGTIARCDIRVGDELCIS